MTDAMDDTLARIEEQLKRIQEKVNIMLALRDIDLDEMSGATWEPCEACGKPATHHDVEGVPLCDEDWDALVSEGSKA